MDVEAIVREAMPAGFVPREYRHKQPDDCVIEVTYSAGDWKGIWDPNNREETEAARAAFDRLKGKGFLAYKVVMKGDKTEPGEVIREFDPKAGRIIMIPPMAGG